MFRTQRPRRRCPWVASRRARLARATDARVLLPAALVTLFLSSELLFQPGLFDFWSPADVLLAWLEYLAELGGIAAAMVAAYWIVDAALERWPRWRRWRLLWMAAAFHAVAFGGLWAMTVVVSGAALLPPTGLALTQSIHWAFIGTLLVVMDTLWQTGAACGLARPPQLASGGAALAREEHELQLRLLQAQIEPHFLFNTLANVRRLYRLHPDQGAQMMDSLKRYLRAALPSVRRADATLARRARAGAVLSRAAAHADGRPPRLHDRRRRRPRRHAVPADDRRHARRERDQARARTVGTRRSHRRARAARRRDTSKSASATTASD